MRAAPHRPPRWHAVPPPRRNIPVRVTPPDFRSLPEGFAEFPPATHALRRWCHCDRTGGGADGAGDGALVGLTFAFPAVSLCQGACLGAFEFNDTINVRIRSAGRAYRVPNQAPMANSNSPRSRQTLRTSRLRCTCESAIAATARPIRQIRRSRHGAGDRASTRRLERRDQAQQG